MSEVSEFTLAFEGNIGALKLRLAEYPKLVIAKDSNERMLLHWACSGGRRDVVDYLLTYLKVPVNEQDDAGWTPLMIAASAGHEDIVLSLLEHNADVHITNFTGQSVLHYAASKNHLTIAEILLRNGAEVNTQDKTTGATPLHRAASRGYLKMVQLLVENGSTVNKEDKQRNTPLHLACEEERLEAIDYLLQHGADNTARNKENLQPTDLVSPLLRRKIQEIQKF